MKKNYTHNVIRIKKGKKTKEQTLWIIATLNKNKTRSSKIVYKIGYIRLEEKRVLALNFYKLAYLLNKGFIIKKSVKNIIKNMLIYDTKNEKYI